jgi:hypothetical protein
VSASPLGAGALQCLWRPPFLLQYIATVALPWLAAAGVIAIFLAVTAARQVRCGSPRGGAGGGRRCECDVAGLRAAVAEWWGQRRHVSTLMVRHSMVCGCGGDRSARLSAVLVCVSW